MHATELPILGKVRFDRHFYFIDLHEGGRASYDYQVVLVKIDGKPEFTIQSIQSPQETLNSYVLLASIAATERTMVTKIAATSKDAFYTVYLSGEISRTQRENLDENEPTPIKKSLSSKIS